MKKNYFIIAFRNLKNNLVFSVLNILGLSIGVACCLVIGLFVLDQTSWDKHHEKADRIYRVVNKQTSGSETSYVAITPGLLAPELIKVFPEIELGTRVEITRTTIAIEGQEPLQEKIMAADSSFFSIFSIQMLQQSRSGRFTHESIYISESAAQRIFSNENAMGKIISLPGLAELRVDGIFRDFPVQSHLRTEFIIPFLWIEKSDHFASRWSANSYYNYLLMPETFDINAFNAKMNAFIHQHIPPAWSSFEYYLQPLTAIHLDAKYVANPSGSVGKIILMGFSLVGMIIMLLACFNYMNMSTAKSAKRGVEVGIRKVVGALRSQLIMQFMIESFILVLVGFLLAIFWADLFLPVFNAVTGFKLSIMDFFRDATRLAGLIISIILLTVFSGSYPAFFLSRFIPVKVLKGQSASDSSRLLRKSLVVVQFTLTSILVVLALVVFKQTHFMKSRDLGFNTQHLLLLEGELSKGVSASAFNAEIKNAPGVKIIAGVSSLPMTSVNTTNIRPAGMSQDESLKTQWMFADHNYISAMELTLVAGRNFSPEGRDRDTGIIINEKAAAALGWKAQDAVGKMVIGFIFSDSVPGEIIGVMKDFNITPLRMPIAPLVMGYNDDTGSYIARLEGDDVFATRTRVDEIAARLTAEGTYNSVFMEDQIEETYAAERKTGGFLTFFTTLAILIGCTGLYALSAYEGERRIKELGIRKIMGATTTELLFLLSRRFLTLIAVSLAIAIPLAWYLAGFWLRAFPYRITLSADIFLWASSGILALAWLTVLSQALKASRLTPADSLRYD